MVPFLEEIVILGVIYERFVRVPGIVVPPISEKAYAKRVSTFSSLFQPFHTRFDTCLSQKHTSQIKSNIPNQIYIFNTLGKPQYCTPFIYIPTVKPHIMSDTWELCGDFRIPWALGADGPALDQHSMVML